jgi:3-hydroxy-3-methylglutaryl CoA synthase
MVGISACGAYVPRYRLVERIRKDKEGASAK